MAKTEKKVLTHTVFVLPFLDRMTIPSVWEGKSKRVNKDESRAESGAQPAALLGQTRIRA